MKGSETKLLKFMEGSDKRFVIPVYQRNYDWKIDNCKQLFNDLIKMVRQNRKSHFFGSIVSVYNPDGNYEEYQVIDGQQRLTTVSLILLAICNLIEEGMVKSEDPRLGKMIKKKFLVDEWADGDSKIKLKPIKDDRSAYEKLFDDSDELDRWSNVTVNYEYFCDRIGKEVVTVDELYKALNGLEVINIKLSAEDNPQLIFESLNSTGLDLTEGDKIRNYILMDLSVPLQNKYYDKYWHKIEQNADFHTDLFIRDYLSIKRNSTPPANRIYFVFKEYVEEKHLDILELLEDLLAYSKLYHSLLTGKTSDSRLSACIRRLNFLETSVTRPFLMEVLRHYENEVLNMDDLIHIFETVESYIVRRSLCDLSTNALNKIFVALNREIIRLDGTTENYVAKFDYVLTSKTDRSRFPDNHELEEAVRTRQVYRMASRNRIYLLERLENHDTIEDKDIYAHLDAGDYSIEHIMPQKLSDSWKESLGEDYVDIHDTWLHRLANLTLTAYNSKYGNASFAQKRDMDKGFAASGLRMNQWIARQKEWGLDQLEERSKRLEKQALKIWVRPNSGYKPPAKDILSLTLADNPEKFVGSKIQSFSFRSEEIQVKSWIEAYMIVLRRLYEMDPAIMKKVASEKKMTCRISDDKSSLVYPAQLDPGIYVDQGIDNYTKIVILQHLFNAYSLEPEDLVFYLRNPKTEDQQAQQNDSLTQCVAYVLPILKKHLKDLNIYQSSGIRKDKLIRGKTSISSFYLLCVFQKTEVRLEFLMNKEDANINKQAFDYLYSHKEEIEASVGRKLVWDRADAKRMSRVYSPMADPDFDNKDEWDHIADFLLKWTRLFIERMVNPYFKENLAGSKLAKYSG